LRGSLRAAIRQTFIQAAVSLFPVTRAYFDWWTGVQAFKSEGFKLLLGGLVCNYKTLDVSSHGESLSFSPWLM